MAIQKLLPNRPLYPRRKPCLKLSNDDLLHDVPSDQGTDVEVAPESGRWSHFPDVDLPDAAPTWSPYFSVVQWWLPEVEGQAIGKHSFVARLGEGAYGRVYASPDSEGNMRAVKVMKKSGLGEDDIQAITSECNFLSQLSHPNICSFKGTINGSQNFYIFMEFAGSTTLYAMLYRRGPLSLSDTRRIFPEILDGVDHIHVRGIAHCDLKPGNIVLSQEGVPKIVDFGLASKIDEANFSGPRGTFPFIAPEAILGQGKAYDLAKGDMWSLGFVLLESTCGVDKVSRMLGWAPNAPMSKLGIMQLISFLNTAKALENAIRLEVGPAAQQLAPVLHYLTFYLPEHRWDTKAAAQMLRGTWI